MGSKSSMAAAGRVASTVLGRKRSGCQHEPERRNKKRSIHTPYYMPVSGQVIQKLALRKDESGQGPTLPQGLIASSALLFSEQLSWQDVSRASWRCASQAWTPL